MSKKISYILPLRDSVIFPKFITPLFLSKQDFCKVLVDASNQGYSIVVLAQTNNDIDNPGANDLHNVGVVINILNIYNLPDGGVKILVEGGSRVVISGIYFDKGFCLAQIDEFVEDQVLDKKTSNKMIRSIKNKLKEYDIYSELSVDLLATLKAVDDVGSYIDLISAHLPFKISVKQDILKTFLLEDRLSMLISSLDDEIDWFKMDRKINEKVRERISEDQKNYFKREKLKVIQQELNNINNDGNSEIELLEKRINMLNILDEVVLDKIYSELNKLKYIPPFSSESGVIRNFLDLVVELPWNDFSDLNTNILKAEKILNARHFGLKSVKERLLEAVAMQIQNPNAKGSILCLQGPPGVGKTSLGQSIANALGREFVRISLGGLRDESEIRGHRRTYLGAMPGKIIKAMARAKTSNPVILLDEIDKISSDYRGDPASALLEVLDPEINKSFNDHYLEVDYDLSNVFFITTANSLNIPLPLLDRLEIISLSGYTEDEKVSIALNHIYPKLLKESNLKKSNIKLNQDLIKFLIRSYTEEAGVRSLERYIQKIIRQYVKCYHQKNILPKVINKKVLLDWLGPIKYSDIKMHKNPEIGLVNGLAWTSVGGKILNIECLVYSGSGQLILTGSLGRVMKESFRAAWSLVKSRILSENIYDLDFFQKHDVHLHVPEGAVPKDGPSAGIAVSTAMYSAVCNFKIRNDVAMTGEVTLRGDVLKIGGLKEKLLAAVSHGIKLVFIPKSNLGDLHDFPSELLLDLEIHGVEHLDEVFSRVFVTS